MAEETKYYSFEEILDRDGSLTYRTQGVSMRPMLHSMRDLVTIRRKGEERCSPGDVALYKRGQKYILHRVIEVRSRDYVILGDNCYAKEYGITDAQVLGVLTSFVRKGREYSVTDPGYLRYVNFMMKAIPCRIAVCRAKAAVRKAVGAIPGVKPLYHRLLRR